jgi:hypothetical protein
MKNLRLLLAALIAVFMLSSIPAFADASKNGCEHSHDKAKGCSDDPTTASTPVSEPGSVGLLATGLVLVGCTAAIYARRRLPKS